MTGMGAKLHVSFRADTQCRLTTPSRSRWTADEWPLSGSADHCLHGWHGSVGACPLFQPTFSEAVILLSASFGRVGGRL